MDHKMIEKSNVIAQQLMEHPDFDDIVAKMARQVPCSKIHEHLSDKYADIDRKYVISEKSLKVFQDSYYDFYTKIRRDSMAAQQPAGIQQALAASPAYMSALQQYAETEIDIRSMAKRLIVNIETRAAQLFDQSQQESESFHIDNTLINWMNLLLSTIEKFDRIQAGPQDNITVNNTINIQVVDRYTSMISGLITEILNDLDVETSNLFIERFGVAMSRLQAEQPQAAQPIDVRLAQTTALAGSILPRLNE